MPSNTLRDSVNGGGERETSGSRGGCTQISPAPFLSTPHSCPIAQKRKRGLEGAPGPGQSMASQSSWNIGLCPRNTWDSGCWTGCGGTNLHPGFAAHTSPLNSHSSSKLLVQGHLLREASITPGGPGRQCPRRLLHLDVSQCLWVSSRCLMNVSL